MGELGITEIGAIGIFSLIVIKELFALIKSLIKRPEPPDSSLKIIESLEAVVTHWAQVVSQIDEMHRKVNALFDWHSVKDQDGLPLWYNRASTTNDIKDIKEAFSIQARLLDSIHDKQMNIEKEVKSRK